jgi:hypothetical protein
MTRIIVTRDGSAAIALDRDNRLIWIDLEAAHELLNASVRTVSHNQEN